MWDPFTDYDRFTDRARQVMKLAKLEAKCFSHEHLCTEHILLGIVKEGTGVAAHVLNTLNVNLQEIRLEVEKMIQPNPVFFTGEISLTSKAENVIKMAREESRQLNQNYVGTEHLLLGMLRTQDGAAAQVLMNLGLNCDDVRTEIVNLLGYGITKC